MATAAVEAASGKDTSAPRSSDLQVAAQVSRFNYAVPQSLYGTVIFMPVLVEVDDIYEWVRWHGMSYFWMAVNFTVQALFMFGIHDTSVELHHRLEKEGCEELISYLLGIAFFCTTVCVMTDLQETWDILYILRRFIPTVEKTTTLKFKPASDGELKLAEGGMTLTRKTLIALCILIPKMILALALLLQGFAFLAVSPANVEIILNATALVFVIEMDEAMFAYFSLPEVRQVMEAVPEFEEDDPKNAILRFRPMWRFLKFLFCCTIVVVGMVTFNWCGNDHGINFLPLAE